MSRNLPVVERRDVKTVLDDFDTAFKTFKELLAGSPTPDLLRLRFAEGELRRLADELTLTVTRKVASTNHNGASGPAILASS